MPPHIRPRETVDSALWLSDHGFPDRQNARIHEVAVKTIRRWRRHYQRRGLPRGGASVQTARCPRCDDAPLDESAYAHLLGWYLGDGCLASSRRGVFVLSVINDARYVGLNAEVMASMAACKPRARARQRQRPGAMVIELGWKHWPCLFPQHGAGPKHTRRIVLEDWQRKIVAMHTGRFLRGLFHSDGCRCVNRVTRPVAGQPKRYEYPRYFFTNASDDIRQIACWALDLCGIAWRPTNARTISVSRKAAVAALDEMVGPKQ
ncbi:MAG: transcriptional regulator [Nocardioidaceae bacterium]